MTDEVAAAVVALSAHLRLRLRAAGLETQAALLDGLGPEHLARKTSSRAYAVLAHLTAAVDHARGHLPVDVGAALSVVADAVSWTQTAAYVAQPPNADFLDGYAHATITADAAAAVGLLLLGPHVDYPPHRHPADEVYLPLAGARWAHGDALPPDAEPAGTLLHHRPWQAHAMTTGDQPLLALYVWTGEVDVASAWC